MSKSLLNTDEIRTPTTYISRTQRTEVFRYWPGGLDDFFFNWLIGGGIATLIVILLATKISFFRPFLIQIAIACGLLTAMVAYHLARKRRRAANNDFRLNIIKDLSKGLAEVCTFEINEAIAVEEFEDEGTGYYLKVGTNQVLFVVGQHLDGLAAEKKFPSTTIEFVRSSKAQISLGLTPCGKYLPPIGTRSPFTKEEFKKELVPCDGNLFETDFELFKKEIHRMQ